MVRLRLRSSQEDNRPILSFFSVNVLGAVENRAGGRVKKRVVSSAVKAVAGVSCKHTQPGNGDAGSAVAPNEAFQKGRSSRLQWRVPFAIRDSQPEDFERLWRIDQECFPPGISYSKQELKAYMRSTGAFTVVAHQAETIGGFLVAQSGQNRGGIGHIITIDVVAAFRRSGLGSLLLEAAEDRLRKMGSSAVGLETAVDNLSALAFYKRHGYSVIRTWPRYYSNGVDALVMRKELARR